MSRSGLPWLSVLTCPARPEYLAATVAAIDVAGGAVFPGTKVISVDGDNALPMYDLFRRMPGWVVAPCHRDHRGHGSAASMLEIVRAAAADDAASLLYFEDDVILCRNAVSAIARMPVPPDCWALQFCDLKRRDAIVPVGWSLYGPIVKVLEDHHWGNQALRLPRATLEHVVRESMFQSRIPWPQPHSSDVLLGGLASSDGRPYLGVAAPSIVQHIGAASICNPNRELSEYGRSAHNFPGVDFDALSLLGDQ